MDTNETTPILSSDDPTGVSSTYQTNDHNNNNEAVQSEYDEAKPLLVKTPKVYKRRWFILLIQSMQSLLSAFYQTMFTSITSSVLRYYRMKATDGWKVSLTASVYLMLSFPVGLLAAYTMKKKGLRFSLFIGSILAFISAWIRFAGFKSGEELFFWIAFAGYVVGALSSPFVVNTGTLLSKTWFPAKQRTIATTITSFLNIVGTGVAFGAAAGLAGDANYNNDLGMIELLALQAILASVFLIIVVIFFQDKPPSPPYMVNEESPEEELSFLHEVKKMFTNIPFIFIWLAFGFGVGSVNCFLTELNSIATPQGYSVNEVAFMGISFVATGLLGAALFGVAADITKRYKLILLIAGIPAAGCYVWFSVNNLAIRTDTHFILAMVSICLIGFFGIPLVPIMLEMACELTYPVPESFSASLMFGIGNLMSVIFIFISEALKQTQIDPRSGREVVLSMQNSMWFCMSMLLCSVALACLVKPVYKRMEHEKKLHEQSLRNLRAINN
ncbi:hypothetical protein C9374_007644 [Naegleria lovaniensis]|uniref:Major facilitator superfamily (MFS) profile domain-containing protein n=1 Tax=Naegleria lovaniensis TaxID=51637 RepID=A0AA88GKW8_NAELO|nr:uncharacterized protein C9374_007644 [Naegleria lovaniensis]KAG2379006.1 hypothetical protein C9374_007644 [Naegleria lovaniensis]